MPDLRLLAAPLAAALLAACASTPTGPAAPAPSGCGELQAALAQADAAQAAAQDRRQNAWQAVVPFVVAARYASARADADAAARQREALQARAAELACPAQEG